jgi:predicted transposase YdaD
MLEGVRKGKAEGMLEGKAEGRAEGMLEGTLSTQRKTLLRLLERAGIALTDADHARIEACRDAAVLERWIDNSIGAKSAAEVLI